MIVFGPIPSRRLGRSLGINNIPPKHCTYSCIYCQAGPTDKCRIDRTEFYKPDVILEEVKIRLEKLKAKNESIDFITFVPDGEPTLDINLGYLIEQLKATGNKLAVISNASLLNRKDVRSDLFNADLVSIKVDTVDEKVWRKINRPHGKLRLSEILIGIKEFMETYQGSVFTETMLVNKVNDSIEVVSETAEFIKMISPERSFLLVPIRPPLCDRVLPSPINSVNRAYQIFNDREINTRIISGDEGNNFTFIDDVEAELLSITSVHPMTYEAINKFITESSSDWSLINKMIESQKLRSVEYSGKKYFIKN